MTGTLSSTIRRSAVNLITVYSACLVDSIRGELGALRHIVAIGSESAGERLGDANLDRVVSKRGARQHERPRRAEHHLKKIPLHQPSPFACSRLIGWTTRYYAKMSLFPIWALDPRAKLANACVHPHQATDAPPTPRSPTSERRPKSQRSHNVTLSFYP
jgi:hypothetical protein